MTVQGPVKKQQPDTVPQSRQEWTLVIAAESLENLIRSVAPMYPKTCLHESPFNSRDSAHFSVLPPENSHHRQN